MRTLEEQTAAARQVLRGVFGFDGFRPGQEAAIEALLAGRNVLTVMPTGSGKSLCFQIPALITDGLTVVVSPLVALMHGYVVGTLVCGIDAVGRAHRAVSPPAVSVEELLHLLARAVESADQTRAGHLRDRPRVHVRDVSRADETDPARAPVHLWGGACDMDAIMKIARKHDLLVLEDACTGIGGAYEGRMLGTIGHAGAYSFNYYKNITAGEGGGVVTSDPEIDKRVACSIDPCHHYWTGRTQDMMPFADNGGRASEILGAVLSVQLDRPPGMIEAMRTQRHHIVEGTCHLDNLGLRVAPMHSPDHDVAAHVIYNLPSAEAASTFAGVCPSVIAGKTGRHTYVDWDQVLMGQGAGHPAMNPYNMEASKDCRRTYSKDMCPRSLELLDRTVMVPMNPELTEADVEQTIRNIEAGARVAAGEITRDQAEVRQVDKIDPRKYDADVAAYGLG